jgi:dihydropteroate synthase
VSIQAATNALPPLTIWGVLNITPDSFSDGGKYLEPAAALSHARGLLAQGADVVDVGAESTRPGAERIGVDEEIARLTPVVSELVAEGHRVSVDTMNAPTARAMADLGVGIINDVSGGLADPDMFSVIADTEVTYVLMHWRGQSKTMDDLAHYDDVVFNVASHLAERVNEASEAGIEDSRIMVDPGFGFSKNPDHNWQLCRGINRIVGMGYPVLAGVSRKRFIGATLPDGHDMAERDWPSALVGAELIRRGVSHLRVHSVTIQRQALEIMARMDGSHG